MRITNTGIIGLIFALLFLAEAKKEREPPRRPIRPPTVSPAPTSTVKPSFSFAPTIWPSISLVPSLSPAPSEIPTTAPSASSAPSSQPSISKSPTGAPTTASPTAKPSQSPTTANDAVSLPLMEFKLFWSSDSAPEQLSSKKMNSAFESFFQSFLRTQGMYSTTFENISLTTSVSLIDDGYTELVENTGAAYFRRGGLTPSRDELAEILMTYFSFWGADNLKNHLILSGFSGVERVEATMNGVKIDGLSDNQDDSSDSSFVNNNERSPAGIDQSTGTTDENSLNLFLIAGIAGAAAVVLLAFVMFVMAKRRQAKEFAETDSEGVVVVDEIIDGDMESINYIQRQRYRGPLRHEASSNETSSHEADSRSTKKTTNSQRAEIYDTDMKIVGYVTSLMGATASPFKQNMGLSFDDESSIGQSSTAAYVPKRSQHSSHTSTSPSAKSPYLQEPQNDRSFSPSQRLITRNYSLSNGHSDYGGDASDVSDIISVEGSIFSSSRASMNCSQLNRR